MVLMIVTFGTCLIAIIFMVMWLRERRHAAEAEIVAYGLRSEDESDENTKTSISTMESGYNEAVQRLEELGEIRQDNWGRWVWDKSGKQLGENEQAE